MKIVQPNCRVRLTAEDFTFIAGVLKRKNGDTNCLIRLLSDPEERDLLLDDEQLYHSLLQRNGCLQVSARFYFYVLVRNVLKRANINDRSVADYVAEVLAEFTRQERLRCVLGSRPDTCLNYFFEILAALKEADDRTAFSLRLHIGNYSLFLAGVFPERIRSRAELRGFPELTYYEGLGRAHYRVASDHRLAQRYELAGILGVLSERFSEARMALNDIAERLFSINDEAPSPKALLEMFSSRLN